MKTATDKGTQTLLGNRLLKVLLVDDEATDRIPVERILRTCSSPAEFTVESAVRLSEAIKKLTGKQYDVVLLDLELPDCSGIEILHQVVKVAPDIPVVVLTELDDEQTGFSALEDGATDYLVKDLPLDVVLVRTIVYAIQRKKIQMQSLKLAHDNNERMKELNCLYGISKLVEDPGIPLEEILEKIARIIPAGWQYPDIACARIVFKGKEYKTDNFKPSKWTQSADITLQGQKVGMVEVSYMEERLQFNEGQFLVEKRDLIDDIGERIGHIAERKKAEETQKRFVTLVEATPDFVGFADAKDKHIIYVNKAGRKMCGIGNDEDVTKLNISDVHPEWANKMLAEEILPAAVRDGVWIGECAFLNIRDRHEIPVLMALSSHKASNGEVEVVSTISHDITERKKAEENLAILNQKNELILRSTAEGILGLDLHGNHIFVNPAAAKMLGYEAEELIGRPSHSAWHHTKPDGSPYPKEECQIYASFLNGVVHRSSLDVFWRKDGTSFPVEYASTPIYEQSRLVGTVVTFADITERKKAEETLREKSALLVKVINSVPDFIFAKDSKLHTIICNEAYASAVGKKPDEMIGHTDIENGWDSELVCGNPAKGIRGFENDDRDALSGKTIHNPYDPANTPNGVLIFDTYKMPLRGKDGEIIGMLGIARDITESKKAEETLRESERKKHAFFDRTFQLIGLTTTDGILVEANRMALEFSGVEASSVLNKPFWQGPWWAHSPELQEKLRQAVEKAARGESICFEATHVDKNGMLHYVDFSLKPVKDETGKVIFLIPEGSDITGRKQAEEALRESEERYKNLFMANIDGMLVANAATKKFRYANPAICRMLGYSEEELTQMGVADIHPKESLEQVLAEFEAQTSGAKITAKDLPCVRKDGQVISVSIRAVTVMIDQAKYLLGIFHDITERKNKEKQDFS